MAVTCVSWLILGRIKGRVSQHLAASNWQLAKPQKPRAENRAIIEKTSSFDVIWGQFDAIQARFNAKFLGWNGINPLES